MQFNRCMRCMREITEYPCPHCGYAGGAQKEFALKQGTILNGRYVVGCVLGQGGFGLTYVGWDLSLDTKVAIKEYYPSGSVMRTASVSSQLQWSSDERTEQLHWDGMDSFLREARKMARIARIPGVVRVQDLFSANETAYIVMEFAEGETLKSILAKSGPMTWDQAKNIFIPALETLEQVHRQGIIHRDISPDNLMIAPDGTVQLLDLGAAKDLNVNTGASSMLVAKGGFSPYELYSQRGSSGPWTDVYAMGATMYYTLTGTVPPTATDRLYEDSISWDLPRLKSLPPQVTAALKRALQLRAEDRPQSAGALLAALRQPAPAPQPAPGPAPAPKPAPAPAPDPSKQEAPKQKKKKNRFPVILLLAFLVVAGCYYFDYTPVTSRLTAWFGGSVSYVTEQAEKYFPELYDTLGEKFGGSAYVYGKAQDLMTEGRYSEAAERLSTIPDYEDASTLSMYCKAMELRDAGEYDSAKQRFQALGSYKDSADMYHSCYYLEGKSLMNGGSLAAAAKAFGRADGYADSTELAEKCEMLLNMTFSVEYLITTDDEDPVECMTYDTAHIYLADVTDGKQIRMRLVAENGSDTDAQLNGIKYVSDDCSLNWNPDHGVPAKDAWRFWTCLGEYEKTITVGEHTGTWYVDGIPVLETSYTVHSGPSLQAIRDSAVAENVSLEVYGGAYAPGSNRTDKKYDITELSLSRLPSGDELYLLIYLNDSVTGDSVRFTGELDGNACSWDEYTSDGKRHGFYFGGTPLTAGKHSVTLYINGVEVYDEIFTVAK